MFCIVRSFCEKPCASSASLLICVGVDCWRVPSQVRDLNNERGCLATCGFRNHCIKSDYETSRVTSTRRDASCA